MIVIPNWETYLGSNVMTKLTLASPYQSTSADSDSEYEESGFSGGKVDQIAADKITTGVLTAVATLGGGNTGYVRIEGDKQRIIVNDGTTDIIGIGNLP